MSKPAAYKYRVNHGGLEKPRDFKDRNACLDYCAEIEKKTEYQITVRDAAGKILQPWEIR